MKTLCFFLIAALFTLSMLISCTSREDARKAQEKADSLRALAWEEFGVNFKNYIQNRFPSEAVQITTEQFNGFVVLKDDGRPTSEIHADPVSFIPRCLADFFLKLRPVEKVSMTVNSTGKNYIVSISRKEWEDYYKMKVEDLAINVNYNNFEAKYLVKKEIDRFTNKFVKIVNAP